MDLREKSYISAIEPLPKEIKSILRKQPEKIIKTASEIRLRAGRPIIITGKGEEHYLYSFGQIVKATSEIVNETFRNICEHSVYSHQEEIKNGYITFKGGHRAGVCGTAFAKGGRVDSVRDITSLCIRIAGNEEITKSDTLDNILNCEGSVLIAGPPGSGKTTILRNCAKNAGTKVSVIDERSELAGNFQGENILSAEVDIFTGYPKPQGIEIATRCFSPRIIICDEIAPSDTDAILNALFSGVRLIASVHAGNKKELFSRPFLKRLFSSGAFKKVVLLKSGNSPGEIEEIIDIGESL